jgi:hypothetical protein
MKDKFDELATNNKNLYSGISLRITNVEVI